MNDTTTTPKTIDGHEVLYESNPAMFRNAPFSFVGCIILSVVGVGLIILLVWWIKTKGTHLTITDDRTTLRRGIFSKDTNDVWHDDIRNVRIEQSFIQRITNVGDIGISSAGQADVEIGVKGMPNPSDIKEIIYRFRDDD